MKRCD